MKKRRLLILLLSITVLFLVACGSKDNNNKAKQENNSDNVVVNNEDDPNVFDPTGGHETNTQKYADVFEEADKVADKARLAFMRFDYEGFEEIASPLLLEQMENNEAEIMGIDVNNKTVLLPNAEEIVGEFYDFGRYDELYDEDEGIVWYEVGTLSFRSIEGLRDIEVETDTVLLSAGKRLVDEPEKILDIMYPYSYSRVFGVKKNPNGEWKVGVFHRSLDGVEIEPLEFRSHVIKNINYIHEKPSELEVKENYMEQEDSFGF